MPRRYYEYKIHTLFSELVAEEKFRIFCYDQPGFKAVYDQLGGETATVRVVDYLVELADDDNSALATLLSWAEETYPAAYRAEAPYWFAIDDGDEPAAGDPYRGLSAFREEDAPIFFGREDFIRQLVEAAHKRSLVAVIGPSGSGKSSVIFAGLVPQLRREGAWAITQFRPGRDPFQALAVALLPLYELNLTETAQLVESHRLAQALQQGELPLTAVIDKIQEKSLAGRQLLLIADQFEELYTLCPEPEIRQHFLDTLLSVIAVEGEGIAPPLKLVLSLRADFLRQALTYRPLVNALQAADVKLGPMTQTELRAVIEQPALRQGVLFEPGLVQRILDDVGNEPGRLPLLEFALTELWAQQTRGQLTHTAYEAIGKVEGALTHYANQIYRALSEAEQELTSRVFTQMVRPGAGTEDTRRLARQAELGEVSWALVQKLASSRLVVTNRDANNEETVEVVHEALIRGWDQLRIWMERDRQFRTWQERLRFLLRQWQADEPDEDALLRGRLLAEAEAWLEERAEDLSPTEKAFIQASVALREQDAAEAEARRQAELEAARQLAREAEARQKAEADRAYEAEARARDQAEASANLRRRAVWLAVAGALAVLLAVAAGWFGISAARSASEAKTERDNASTAEAKALQQQAIAEAVAAILADQNEKAQAELAFYQTTDPAERLQALHDLFSWEEAESQARARRHFFGLPRLEQLSLLAVTERPEALLTVSQAILPNLADINGVYYTDAYLTTLQEAVTDTNLQNVLEGWLAARQAAQDEAYEKALDLYGDLLQSNDQNAALWYERARVRAKLEGQTAEALADLEKVMALAQAEAYQTSVVSPNRPEFATAGDMTKAVQRLMMVNPDLAAEFERTRNDYPDLAAVALPTIKTDQKGVPMVQVPAGPFRMGSNVSPNEQPVHMVYLDEYYIDQYEVTNDGYRECVTAGACEVPACEETYEDETLAQHPVVCISWFQAQAYCQWRRGSLPSEAQWEKAARGADERTYPWGEGIGGHLARYWGSSEESGSAPVGHYPEGVSPYGAYDMAGNVWEWVADAYDGEYYKESPASNPTGPEDSQNIRSKVLRGGSWYSAGGVYYARASTRYDYFPGDQLDHYGVRCVVSAP